VQLFNSVPILFGSTPWSVRSVKLHLQPTLLYHLQHKKDPNFFAEERKLFNIANSHRSTSLK